MATFSGTIKNAPNFTYEELVASDTAKAMGIDNTPADAQIWANIEYLAQNVLQPLRDALNRPIVVSSGYRSPKLNKAVGGASTSHHLTGCAADIRFNRSETTLKDVDIFSWLYHNVPFTELIAEGIPFGWIHVALVKGREDKATKYMLSSQGVVKSASYATIIDLYAKYGL